MAMKLPTPPTQAPRRGLPRTSGSLSTAVLRILAMPLGDSASAAISGTTFERSRMPPLESMIPGFSRPRGPKRTSFMDSPQAGGQLASGGGDHASGGRDGQGGARSRGQDGVRTISGSERCVRKGTCAPRICCPSATDAEILVKRAVYAAFSFAIGTFRGQDYHMDLVRAPSCKRRGFGGRHTMASPLLRAVPGHLV